MSSVCGIRRGPTERAATRCRAVASMSRDRQRTSQPIWVPLVIVVLLVIAVVSIVDDASAGNQASMHLSTRAVSVPSPATVRSHPNR